MSTIQGTIVRFIPKQYQSVPDVQDLLKYYTQHQIKIDDSRALGMIITDDDEKSHTFYASVSLIMNTLTHLDNPIKVKSRVSVDYTTNNGKDLIQHIKVLPVLFERNQEHDDDKNAPKFIRRGAKKDEKAQPLSSFNPLLAVPNNLNHKDDPTRVLPNDYLKNLRNPDREMKEIFNTTLKDTEFDRRSKDMFQQAQGQTQSIVDLIFHNEYLDFTHSFNQVHPENFEHGDAEQRKSRNDTSSDYPSHMDL